MQKPLFAFLLHLLVRLSAANSLNQCTISHLTLAHQWESLLRAIYNHPGINREHHGLLPNMKFYGRHSGVCITYFKMRAVLHNVGYRTSHLQSTTSSLMYSSQAKNSFLPLLCRSPAHSHFSPACSPLENPGQRTLRGLGSFRLHAESHHLRVYH